MSWAVFREVHFKVISAVLVVIASMLLLQSGLNQLKFRSLVADATASSLQVIASSVETAVQRAEQVGLAIEEMTGLEDLMTREMERHDTLSFLMVVSPIGKPLVSVGAEDLPADDREAVLRRVLGSGERLTSLDMGDVLYVGRVLYDSSNLPMGSIILATPTQEYAEAANRTVEWLNILYAAIFVFVAILLIPFIIIRFSGLVAVFRMLDAKALKGDGPTDGSRHPSSRHLRGLIAEGNTAYAQAEEDLEALIAEETANDPSKNRQHDG